MNWIQRAVIELPFIKSDIEDMIDLGLNSDQIRKVAESGIIPSNHWRALVYSMECGEIDAMLEHPTVYIKGIGESQ